MKVVTTRPMILVLVGVSILLGFLLGAALPIWTGGCG